MDKEIKKDDLEAAEPKKVNFKERITGLYPDVNPQSDDELDALYNRYADEKESEISSTKEMLQVIEDQMNADEDLRAVVTDMVVNKTPFRVAIAKFLSEDDLTPLPTDEDYDAVRAAHNERVEKGKAQAQMMDQINKNEEQTYKDFEAFVAEHNFNEEQAQELNDTIGEVFTNLLHKKITPEMLEMFRKAMDYDNAIAKASDEGEVRGRNAAIEAKRVASESNKGDGIPNLVGGGAEPQKKATGRVSFLGPKRNNI